MPEEAKETIIIPKGTMINLSRHEDDEPLIANEDIKATVVNKKEKDAIEVILPEIPDQTFFIHQPEAPKKE